MTLLLFEIWRNSDGSFSFSPASRDSDEFRSRVEPNAVLVGSFHAASDFEAFQKNNDWHGWGLWKPEAGWSERCFSDTDAAAQEAYLRVRTGP